MPQRLGPRAADAGVAGFLVDDVRFAFGLDPRQFQLVAHDLGQLFQRNFDLQDMAAGIAAGLAACRLHPGVARADRVALFAVALTDAARAVLAVAKVRHVELRDGNADQIAPLAADHLAVGHVFPQVLANFAPYDLLETRLVSVDFDKHGPFSLLRAPWFRMGLPRRSECRQRNS